MASGCAASACCSDAKNNQSEDEPVLEQSVGEDEPMNGSRNCAEHDGESEPAADKKSTNISKKRCLSSSGRGLDDEDMEEIIRHRNQDPAWIEERRHYQKIARTFRNYMVNFNKKLSKSLEYLSTLPESHRNLLENYRDHLLNVKRCAEENQNLFLLMVMEESRLFENHDDVYPSKAMKKAAPEPTAFDFDKLQAVLKQIVRDWAEEGQQERDLCYKPILEEVDNTFKKTKGTDGLSDIKILVPGAGLGRLAHDLVKLGYAVEGNEFSLFMLFASNFLLNKCSGTQTYRCFPWIHQSTNVLNTADQVRTVHFPDIDPGVLPPGSRFSMTAGDFLEVYGNPHQKEEWDCIVTCFFIDCANNIVEYLERIYYCLKFGGTWINLGPLLYHYADMSDERSIEPPYDILIEIVKKLGFVVEKENKCLPTLYSDNSKSMLSYTYNSVFLVCTKSNPATNGIQDLIKFNKVSFNKTLSPTQLEKALFIVIYKFFMTQPRKQMSSDAIKRKQLYKPIRLNVPRHIVREFLVETIDLDSNCKQTFGFVVEKENRVGGNYVTASALGGINNFIVNCFST